MIEILTSFNTPTLNLENAKYLAGVTSVREQMLSDTNNATTIAIVTRGCNNTANVNHYLECNGEDTSDNIRNVIDYGQNGYSLPQEIALGIVLSTFVILAVAGNLLVCISVVTDRHLRKRSNVFIVSLAVADASLALLVMSFAVLNDLNGYWMLGDTFCSIWICFDVMFCTASILNLCAISLDRYIHIRSPLHYETFMSPKRTVMFLAAIWILSGLISFVPIQLEWHKLGVDQSPAKPNSTQYYSPVISHADNYTRSHMEESNSYDWRPTQPTFSEAVAGPLPQCVLALNPIYAVTSSVISFYLPCLVMICIYLRLYRYAMRHAKTIKKTMTTSFRHVSAVTIHITPATTPINSPKNGVCAEQHHYDISPDPNSDRNGACVYPTQTSSNKSLYYRRSDHKAAITLGVIMGTFLFCWTPFFTINITSAFCSTCIPPTAFSVTTWLGYFNSTLNPIIYSIFNKEFRHAFHKVLRLAFPWHVRKRARDRLHRAYARENSMSINTSYYKTSYYPGQLPPNGKVNGAMAGSDSYESQAATPCYAENKLMFNNANNIPHNATDNTSL